MVAGMERPAYESTYARAALDASYRRVKGTHSGVCARLDSHSASAFGPGVPEHILSAPERALVDGGS